MLAIVLVFRAFPKYAHLHVKHTETEKLRTMENRYSLSTLFYHRWTFLFGYALQISKVATRATLFKRSESNLRLVAYAGVVDRHFREMLLDNTRH
jgi:hypothetical protein